MRKNISLSAQVEERAKAIIEARGFDGLSDLIAALVREEYERRQPPVLQEPPANSQAKPSSGDVEAAIHALAAAMRRPKREKGKPQNIHSKPD